MPTRLRELTLHTVHGRVITPCFMPIATKGAVKGLTSQDLNRIGAKMILANTYHLYLRPGLAFLQAHGGLHQFMAWEGPILTDSGGYQVFSLGSKKQNNLVKILPDGVMFKDYLTGSEHFFTPQKVLEIQAVIGSDIRMVLDICSPYPCSYSQAKNDLALTLKWAEIGLAWKAQNPGHYQLFAIIQGGQYQDLRIASSRELVAMGFDGYAIGGVSVGESWEEARQVLDWVLPYLPTGKPRYLMGVGLPEQILESISLGVDLFDCVIPTREARHGRLYLAGGKINIFNRKYKTDTSAINPLSRLWELTTYSRAYLRHLFLTEDPLAWRLGTLNNLEFYLNSLF